jgi:hypothetical protein
MSSTTIRVIIDGKGSISGLDPLFKGLNNVGDAAKRTQKEVERAVKFDFTATIPQLKTLQNNIQGIGSALGAVRNVATGGIIGAAVIRGLSAAVDESLKLENALIGVNSVAKAFAQDTDAVKKAVLDFTKDGLVPATDAALAFKQILSTGTSLPDAIKLLNSLKDVAAFNRQSFYTLGEAIVATTEGIKNGNSVRADAVGVTKNLSVLEKEYAASVGKTVGALTDAEKIQARVAGFIRESGFAAGDAAKLLDTYSGSVSQLGTAFDRALAKIGSFVTQSGTVKTAITTLTSFFNSFEESLTNETTEKRIEKIKSQLNGFLKDAGDSPYKKELEAELRLLERHVSLNKQRNNLAVEAKTKELEVKKAIEDSARAQAEAVVKRAKDLKKLDVKIEFGGQNELQKLDSFYAKSLKLIGNDAARKIQLDKYYYAEKERLEEKSFEQQQRNARKLQRIQEQITEALTNGAQNPFGTIVTPETVKAAGQEREFRNRTNLGRSVGVLSNVVGGAEGAKKLVSGLGAAALEAVLPGLGEAAKPILEAFTQGPDAVRGMVKEFAKAIPDVVEGFILAIPAFLEELGNQLPVIIEKLAEKAPDIITKLVEAAPKVGIALTTIMPKVALKFTQELIKNIPKIVSEIARAVYDAITGVFKNNNPLSSKTGGGGIAGALRTGPTGNGAVNFGLNVVTLGGSGVASESLKKLGIKFATGGEVKMATGGAPFTDSIDARLQNGEVVVDHSTTRKLKKALNEDSFGGGKEMMAELRAIRDLLSRPFEVSADAKLNSEVFAKIILNLNRTNQRLS